MKKQTIQKHGTLFELDNDGFIINHLVEENLQDEFRPLVDEAIRLCQEYFGGSLESVFLRGSVAAGNAKPSFSDIDFILVFQKTPKNVEHSINRVRASVENNFADLVQKVELVYAQKDDIRRPLKILLKTQSLCLFGKNISKDLPKVHITKADQHQARIREEIEQTLSAIDEIDDSKSLKQRERWILSRLIRALFENVMPQKKVYTRSLSYGTAFFTEYYPEFKDITDNFLEHAINPSGEKESIQQDLHHGLDILDAIEK